MSYELIVFIVMVGTFMACCFALRLPASVAMLTASVAGIAVGAWGMPPVDMLRQLFEGSMSFVDTIMVIAFAMVFMKVVEASGMLNALSVTIIRRFHRWPMLLLICIMAIIMFPGMITGSSTAAILSAGSIMVPVLLMMGLDRITTAAIIAMGALTGMVAPPVNLPAMIIGGGIDTPFVGFELPLLLLTVPVAIFSVLYLGYKQAKRMNYAEIQPQLDTEIADKYGFKLYIPLLVLIVVMVANKMFPQIPYIGLPGAFLLASVVGCFTGKRFNPDKVLMDAVKSALPVMGILMGVGMFIQVMTLTGVRGFIVDVCLSMPNQALVGVAALSIPLFGMVSAFGAASVLGVPFTLAMLQQNTIVTIAALSQISALGDMMPPTALASMFAAEVAGVDKYARVFRRALVPMLVMLIWSVLFIYLSNPIAAILP